jgi:hypothetical protein
MRLALIFGSEVDRVARRRVEYAFRVFAAVYGHVIIDLPSAVSELSHVVTVFYGHTSSTKEVPAAFRVPSLYLARKPELPAPIPRSRVYADETFELFFGEDPTTRQPDWLGEIFEWLSAADEHSIVTRDSVGRIPYSQTIFARGHVTPGKAHASRMMAWLQGCLDVHCGIFREALPPAPSPLSQFRHLVVCSHDIDYYYCGRLSASYRVLKNVGIALLAQRNAAFLRASLHQLARLLRGQAVGDFLPNLVQRATSDGFRSTIFVISRRAHRRDANYEPLQIAKQLRKAVPAGMGIGLHGSYRSVIEDRSLKEERQSLTQRTLLPVEGTRQHWLRFDTHENLFRQVEAARFLFDSTLGFSEVVGFRNGAAFPFPPYDFAKEAPCQFLEIPLVVMDATLSADPVSRDNPLAVATPVLDESRRWGWGGISLLWHNPVEPLGVTQKVNDVFWHLLRNRAANDEAWIEGRELFNNSLERFHQAGLLSGLTRSTESRIP